MLSAYNSGGRPLGPRHANLICLATGCTLEDLGKPEEEGTVEERLARLEETVDELRRRFAAAAEIAETLELLRRLPEDPPAERTPQQRHGDR